jgi:hypothetical protein
VADARHAHGGIALDTRYLGIWAFVLAALVVLGGVFAAGHMHRMHEGMHCPFMDRRADDRLWERREHGEPGAPPEAPPAAPPGPPASGGPPGPK